MVTCRDYCDLLNPPNTLRPPLSLLLLLAVVPFAHFCGLLILTLVVRASRRLARLASAETLRAINLKLD
ncbi:MAG: hypothetical protein ACTS6G_01160 [Candidatus Hodgkinia cicadicola]